MRTNDISTLLLRAMDDYKYSVVIVVCLLALGDVVLGESCASDLSCYGNKVCRNYRCHCAEGYTENEYGSCNLGSIPAHLSETVRTVYIISLAISAVIWTICLVVGCCCYRKRSKIVIPGHVLQAGQPGQLGMPVQQVYHQQQYMYNQPPPSYADQKQNPSPYNTQAV